MDLNKIYYDIDGNQMNILGLVKRHPEWAANRIQQMENYVPCDTERKLMTPEQKDALIFIIQGISCLAGEGPDVEKPSVLFKSIIKECNKALDILFGRINDT